MNCGCVQLYQHPHKLDGTKIGYKNKYCMISLLFVFHIHEPAVTKAGFCQFPCESKGCHPPTRNPNNPITQCGRHKSLSSIPCYWVLTNLQIHLQRDSFQEKYQNKLPSNLVAPIILLFTNQITTRDGGRVKHRHLL